MQKSQTTATEQAQLILVLPTKNIPKQLIPLIQDQKDFSVRFINGYRNVFGSDDKVNLAWALAEDQNYCGQAFCYLLSRTVKKQDLLAIKFENSSLIHEANDQMFILQLKSKPQLPKQSLTEQQINNLINEVSQSKESRKLALNLLKNAFDSYQDFKTLVEQNLQKVEKQILGQQQEIIPTVAETVDIEYEAKKVHGEMITKLPKCNQQTGEWDENQHIEIKLIAENA